MDAHHEHPFFMHVYGVANWLEREFTASASCPKSLLSDARFAIDLNLPTEEIKPIERHHRIFKSLIRGFLIPLPCFLIGLFNAPTIIIHIS